MWVVRNDHLSLSKLKIMNKTISSIQPTSINHPAVGRLFKIQFTDNTIDHVYEETFLHQYKFFSPDKYKLLEGMRVNVDEMYFNETI